MDEQSLLKEMVHERRWGTRDLQNEWMTRQ
jgi:hypothetical protein